jgi:hypothetical protein
MCMIEALGVRQSQTPHALMNQGPKGCGTHAGISALRVLHPPESAMKTVQKILRCMPLF